MAPLLLISLVGAFTSAFAEALPSGSVGAVFGVQSGTSGFRRALGVGAIYGLTAAWQPMRDEQRIGWGVRWNSSFGYFPIADSASIDGVLRLVQLEVVARLRIAPTLKPGRYLTIGLGGSLLRSNEPICSGACSNQQRSFVGPITTLGYEYNAFGAVLLGMDLRYGLIETGPSSIGLLLSVGTAL